MSGFDDRLTIIEGTTVISSEVLAGAELIDIAVNPTTGLAYVISNYEKERGEDGRRIQAGYLTVLDGPQVIDSYYLGPLKLTNVIVDPVYNDVYLATKYWISEYQSAGRLIVLDENLQELTCSEFSGLITDMAVNSNTGEVYVSATTPHLRVYERGIIENEVMLGDTVRYPYKMLFHPVTEEVYIIDFTRLEMMVVKDMALLGYVPLEIEPANMVVDPLTGNVYVANARSGTVSVINGIELLDTIKVGAYPYGIGVNPNNGWVYVSNTNGDSVTILGFE